MDDFQRSVPLQATFTRQRYSQKLKRFSLAYLKVYMTMFSKRFAFTHIYENGQKCGITYTRSVVGAVTFSVNSTCREVTII